METPEITAIRAVHRPTEIEAVQYQGSEAVYPEPFNTAIYEHNAWPVQCVVMTPDGPTVCKKDDWVIREPDSTMVHVVPALHFDRLYAQDLGEPGELVQFFTNEKDGEKQGKRGRKTKGETPQAPAEPPVPTLPAEPEAIEPPNPELTPEPPAEPEQVEQVEQHEAGQGVVFTPVEPEPATEPEAPATEGEAGTDETPAEETAAESEASND